VHADAAGVIVGSAASVLRVGAVLFPVDYQGDVDVVRYVVAGPRPPAFPRDVVPPGPSDLSSVAVVCNLGVPVGDSSRYLTIRLRFWLLSYRRSF
jgi:hypothetical protein